MPPEACPEPYYFAFNKNASCCKNYIRQYDPDVNINFEGSHLRHTDPGIACIDQVDCPVAVEGSTCFTNPEGNGMNENVSVSSQ